MGTELPLSKEAEEQASTYGLSDDLYARSHDPSRLRREPDRLSPAWWDAPPLELRADSVPAGASGDDPAYLVRIVQEVRGEPTVVGLHVVPSGSVVRGMEGKALPMLKRFVNDSRYGVPIRAWGNPTPWCHEEIVTPAGPDGEREGLVAEQDGPGIVLENWSTYDSELGAWRVLLAFAVDAAAVRKDLGL